MHIYSTKAIFVYRYILAQIFKLIFVIINDFSRKTALFSTLQIEFFIISRYIANEKICIICIIYCILCIYYGIIRVSENIPYTREDFTYEHL